MIAEQLFYMLLKLDLLEDNHIVFEEYDCVGWEIIQQYTEIILGTRKDYDW